LDVPVGLLALFIGGFRVAHADEVVVVVVVVVVFVILMVFEDGVSRLNIVNLRKEE
jgi:uncharacterized membrane protein (Fun14 family)